MSRIPQPHPRSTAKTALAPPSRLRAPSPSKPAAGASSPRVRTKSVPKSPSKTIRRPPPVEDEPLIPKTPLSIKEVIALKRAEARKAASSSSSSSVASFGNSGAGFDDFENLKDADPIAAKRNEEEILELGRWSVKETIERARSIGSINLSSRSLPCLPSALFEIHLGVTPDPLKSVPSEPLISSSTDISDSSKRAGQREGPAWFEAQDLHVLKAWNNEIVEIQHEISLFGSLKTVDLHQNRITLLPDTFADLTALTNLDLSHNGLTTLPSNIFALPNLTVMNISHNALSGISFGAPFSKSSSRNARNDTLSSGGFFGPVITRASSPLPRLTVLGASYNKLAASSIDYANLPPLISKVDFSANPLTSGDSNSTSAFIQALSRLDHLRELRGETADIGDDAFLGTLSMAGRCFSRLRILDLSETRTTMEGLQSALSGLKQAITYDFASEEPPEGTLRVSVGKKVVREAWEIEAERRMKNRAPKGTTSTDSDGGFRKTDAENNAEVAKEAWEIVAEHGLLTEGGRRRARAAAAMATAPPKPSSPIGRGRPSTPVSTPQPPPTASLTNPQYYHAPTQTLTLPPLSAPTKSHVRSFSLAAPSLGSPSPRGKTDFALPTMTLPLAAISAQSFAQTLKILVLSNRKFDISVTLPSTGEAFLPSLEELVLEGCGFGDQVLVNTPADSGSTTPPRLVNTLLPLLTRLFPSLQTLDLSYNALTSASLQRDDLSSLILADNANSHKGLRHLRLRGNRINDLDGFQGIAEAFRCNRSVPNWKLEELDLRDNEISKLPAELGLLPLDVFLVDGNVFRIPQRRVWEREGTKGLLNWLRGRLE